MKRKTPRPAKAKAPRTDHTDTAVKAALDACPAPARRQLLTLRKLIHDTARNTEGVGPLEEALKWGQVSFLTSESKSGSTIRIDRVKGDDSQVAVFFHCQTNLVDSFRERYPELSYSGNRAILLDAEKKLPEAKLRHCVALALTYHLAGRKKT